MKIFNFIADIVQAVLALVVAVILALDMIGVWSWEGIPWLVENISSITLIAVCLLIVSAFFERRVKLDSIAKDLNKKIDRLISSISGNLKISDRGAFGNSFERRIEKAKEVCIFGRNLVGVLTHYEKFIAQKASKGCKFKIVVCDPNYTFSTGERPVGWEGKSATQIDTDHSVELLNRLRVNKNIKVAYFPVPPHFSLLLIDKGETYGEIQVELLPYEIPESKRPHFILNKINNTEWYSFFQHQFEVVWNKSRRANVN